jgi:hypothetical protein
MKIITIRKYEQINYKKQKTKKLKTKNESIYYSKAYLCYIFYVRFSQVIKPLCSA